MPFPTKNLGLLTLPEALSRLDEKIVPSLSVDDLARLLQECRKEGNRAYALRLHSHLREHGLDAHTLLGNLLIPVLVGAGCMDLAQQVFDRLAHRNNFSWNSLVIGHVQHGLLQHALTLYQSMHKHACISECTFVALLKACIKLKNLELGSRLHAEITRKGLIESNLLVANSVVDMYAKCGLLAEAQEVFDTVQVPDAVLWTALICAYAEYGHGKEALSCFQRMQSEGCPPDATTFVCTLKACKNLGCSDMGQELFTDIAKKGLEKELLIGNTLVDMYAKCGSIVEAEVVFDNQSIRSVVSWNALITAYEGHGLCEEALGCFENMQHEGISPDAITLVCCLKACGSMGILEKGQEVHAHVSRKGLEINIVVGSALVDMYAKCGSVAEGQNIFDKLQTHDLKLWTALIAGFAQCGQTQTVCSMFDSMIEDGLKPNLVTLVTLLTACNHAGLVDMGEVYLDSMCQHYGLTPVHKHYACLIDLFGRACDVDKAITLTTWMPLHPGVVVWHIVLSACQKLCNVEVGRLAFECAVEVEDKDAGAYICMSNIYASVGMKEDASKIEALRVERKAWNMPECSYWAHSMLCTDE